jgi:hypothetical protein
MSRKWRRDNPSNASPSLTKFNGLAYDHVAGELLFGFAVAVCFVRRISRKPHGHRSPPPGSASDGEWWVLETRQSSMNTYIRYGAWATFPDRSVGAIGSMHAVPAIVNFLIGVDQIRHKSETITPFEHFSRTDQKQLDALSGKSSTRNC